jgi:hypothetical protein
MPRLAQSLSLLHGSPTFTDIVTGVHLPNWQLWPGGHAVHA